MQREGLAEHRADTLNLNNKYNLKTIPKSQLNDQIKIVNLLSTPITDISALANLPQLAELIIEGTRVDDLSQIAEVRSLRVLNAGHTPIKALPNLSSLKGLKILKLWGTKITDVSAIEVLENLEELDIAGTQVNDISSLRSLKRLKILDIRSTAVRDLKPVSHLRHLQVLHMEKTPITSIRALEGLQNLRTLSLWGASVKDLSPVSGLSGLIDGAKKGGGLSFVDCPTGDDELIAISKLPPAERTTKALEYLRRTSSKTQSDTSKKTRTAAKSYPGSNQLPKLPKQGHGPHFSVQPTGVIDFESRTLSRKANLNRERARRLQEEVKLAVVDLLAGLQARSNQFPRLFGLAQRYLEQIERPIEKIDFAILYGIGIRLENAIQAADRDILDRISPELEDDDREALDSLLLLHGPFILSSKEARDLLTDAERYLLTEAQISVVRKNADSISKSVNNHRHLYSSDVTEFVSQTVSAIDGPRAKRATLYSMDTIANLVVVTAELAIASSVLGTTGLAGVTAAWALLRTRPEFQEAFATAEDLFHDAHHATARGLKEKVPLLLLSVEAPLRALAEVSPRFKFIPRFYEWLHREIASNEKRGS